MTALDLIGSWRFVRTEIPSPYTLGQEFYHFSPEGIHCSESPFFQQEFRIFQWHYEVFEHGVHLTTRKGLYYRDLLLGIEGQFLVLTGTHGWLSWLERIPVSERPSYLTLFFEYPKS